MNESNANIRILLIDDHTLFRESVARLLHAEPGFEVVGSCGSLAEALEILTQCAVDIVLLDLDLGPERGADFFERLDAENFKGRVLIVTAGVDTNEVPNLIRQGVCGLLMKHNSPALLVRGIREAMQGQTLFSQDLLRKAVESAERVGEQRARSGLGERERHVLSLIFEGLANKQIADRLKISESAVKACLQQLFAKTGVRTRTQLVRIALEQYRDQL